MIRIFQAKLDRQTIFPEICLVASFYIYKNKTQKRLPKCRRKLKDKRKKEEEEEEMNFDCFGVPSVFQSIHTVFLRHFCGQAVIHGLGGWANTRENVARFPQSTTHDNRSYRSLRPFPPL